jgi:hypothetical protein
VSTLDLSAAPAQRGQQLVVVIHACKTPPMNAPGSAQFHESISTIAIESAASSVRA